MQVSANKGKLNRFCFFDLFNAHRVVVINCLTEYFLSKDNNVNKTASNEEYFPELSGMDEEASVC